MTVFCAQVAEVEIDEETGEVKLRRFTTAHDVGAILNPIAHQGQIEGGVMQGIGQAMLEELQIQDGVVANPSLGEYKLPTTRDIPALHTVLVHGDDNGPSPYGGKAIGEQPISAVAPAIANAVLDATGVSIPNLPITSEKVYRAMHAAQDTE
jgi:CO/xanthine dehydrogenase Mo-binding subunit